MRPEPNWSDVEFIPPKGIPTTLAMALELYRHSDSRSISSRHFSNLKSALRTCTLPGYGFNESQLMTKSGFHHCLNQLALPELKNALKVFKKVGKERVGRGEIQKATFNSYKCNLHRFLEWMQQQDWYENAIASLDVDARYAPKLIGGQKKATPTQTPKRPDAAPYCLTQEELTAHLIEQIAALEAFWTAPRQRGRTDKPLRAISITTYRHRIYRFLGWVKNIYLPGIELVELDLKLMTDVSLVREFVSWGLYERENSYAWASQIVKSALFVAKWWESHNPQPTGNQRISSLVATLETLGLKPTHQFIEQYAAVEKTPSLVEALRAYQRQLQQQSKQEPIAPRKLNSTAKLLTFEQCLEVVEYLKQCCASRRKGRQQRPTEAIRQSVQKHLLIKFLVYCPIRQREIRELELGRTLFREPSGYVVQLLPSDHKTGSATGKGREFFLPDVLTLDLDNWLNVWRVGVPTAHQFVFISLGAKGHSNSLGKPLTEQGLYSMVTQTMHRATAVLFGEPIHVTPHDFRRIAITRQRRFGSVAQNEALAEFMGHSVSEAENIYNQMTLRERTSLALNWWQPPSGEPT